MPQRGQERHLENRCFSRAVRYIRFSHLNSLEVPDRQCFQQVIENAPETPACYLTVTCWKSATRADRCRIRILLLLAVRDTLLESLILNATVMKDVVDSI